MGERMGKIIFYWLVWISSVVFIGIFWPVTAQDYTLNQPRPIGQSCTTTLMNRNHYFNSIDFRGFNSITDISGFWTDGKYKYPFRGLPITRLDPRFESGDNPNLFGRLLGFQDQTIFDIQPGPLPIDEKLKQFNVAPAVDYYYLKKTNASGQFTICGEYNPSLKGLGAQVSNYNFAQTFSYGETYNSGFLQPKYWYAFQLPRPKYEPFLFSQEPLRYKLEPNMPPKQEIVTVYTQPITQTNIWTYPAPITYYLPPVLNYNRVVEIIILP
jgi:hypothetical protein